MQLNLNSGLLTNWEFRKNSKLKFHTFVMTSRYDVISKPEIVTWREIIEWAVARPSRVIRRKRAFGKRSIRYLVDLRVNGSFEVFCYVFQNLKVFLYLMKTLHAFITQPLGRFTMFDDDFENKLGNCRIYHRLIDARLVKSFLLFLRAVPIWTHSKDTWDQARFFMVRFSTSFLKIII